MSKPDVVPDKLSNPLNRYIILGILVAGVVIFTIMNLLNEDDVSILAFIMSVSLTICLAIFCFIVSKRHETGLLAKSYLSLGLGFTSYVIAELLYYTFDLILGIEAYPSIADVFFFALYPFVLGHLLLNIRYFHSGYTTLEKIWIPVIPIIALIVYVILSLSIPDAELNFDFYYGFIFVSGASLTLSFTVLGLRFLNKGYWEQFGCYL